MYTHTHTHTHCAAVGRPHPAPHLEEDDTATAPGLSCSSSAQRSTSIIVLSSVEERYELATPFRRSFSPSLLIPDSEPCQKILILGWTTHANSKQLQKGTELHRRFTQVTARPPRCQATCMSCSPAGTGSRRLACDQKQWHRRWPTRWFKTAFKVAQVGQISDVKLAHPVAVQTQRHSAGNSK